MASLGPALLLAGRKDDLAVILQRLDQGLRSSGGGGSENCVSTSDWYSGGAMYLAYLALVGSSGQASGSVDSQEAVAALIGQLRAAEESLLAGPSEMDPSGTRLRLRQRLALSQIAKTVHCRSVGHASSSATASLASVPRLEAMQGVLSLGCLSPDLRLAGISAAATAVSSITVE